MNPLLIGIIATTILGAVGLKLYGMKELADNVSTDLKFRLHKMDFSKITFAIDLIIKNPTQHKVHILQPYIRVIYKGEEIGTSDPSDVVVPILPLKAATLKTIFLSFNLLSSPGIILDLYKKIQDKTQKVKLNVEIRLTIINGIKDEAPARLSEEDISGKKYKLFTTTVKKDVEI